MPEMEQPAPQESEVQETPETPAETVDLFDAEPATTADEPVVDDSEEIDYEGEKYKVPPKLKDAFLRQADYTTKTQTLAQQRQEFEAAQQTFQARQQFQQQNMQAVAKVMAIDERLEQFSKVDWNALTDADPVQAMKLDRQVRELQSQRNQQVQSIERASASTQALISQETARSLDIARAQLAREITGYGTPEIQKGLGEAAKAIGYRPEELANVNDPRAVKLLHKAYLYDQLVAKTKAAPKTEIKPITRVSGASAVSTKSLGDASLSDAEYNRSRREFIRKNR